MNNVSSRRRFSGTNAPALAAASWVLMESLEPRALFSAAPAPTPAELVAQANNAFAFDLLNKVGPDSSGNSFLSPYSADTALEMALEGAKGVTADEMIQALHLPSADLAQAGIQALNQLFQADPATAGYTLSTANRLWVAQDFPVLDSFISDSQNIFGAAPQTVDFTHPDTAADTINAWVSDQTHGKIPALIPSSALSKYTTLVLTNAIYFKGDWARPFNAADTQDAPFQISSTEAATVSRMYQRSELGYYAQPGANGFQAVDLPYVGGNLDMLVLLPATYDVGTFQSTLTPALFSQITSHLDTTDVALSLPKFKLDETYSLAGPLNDLGIQTAFSPSADFSGISSDPVQISAVLQKSFIDVNETGTEAAAATAVITVSVAGSAWDPSQPVAFDANHPFLFAIRDRGTNAILFLGSVSDPSNRAADFVTPPATLPPVHAPPGPGNSGLFPPIPVVTPLSIIAPHVETTELSVRGVVDQKFNGTVGVLRGVSSHAPKLADLSGTIEWGDNTSSPASFVRVGNRTVAVRGSHEYADAGSYTIGIDVTQTPYANGKPSAATPLTMPAMAATASIAARGLTFTATAGMAFTTTLASLELPAIPTGATRGVTIQWGDGSHSAGTLTPNGEVFTITGSHLYHARRRFHVLIDVWQKSDGKQTILTRLKAVATVSLA